ncbi:MAG: PPC domain-containing protein [Terricaulis sp.]|nr:PPC domain-containing protein [Terricaulis sp.]
MRFALAAAPLALFALAACDGGQVNSLAAAGGGQVATPAALTCEAPANPIMIGAMTHGEITAAQSYPENARYYCFSIPQGVQSATVTLSGMTADLDLYVGSGSITSVQGNEAYEWMSNVSGTGDDTITINQPVAGVYYVEVVSYEGLASRFSLVVR